MDQRFHHRQRMGSPIYRGIEDDDDSDSEEEEEEKASGGSVVEIWCFTPLKTNMSLENQWLEDVFPTEIVTF